MLVVSTESFNEEDKNLAGPDGIFGRIALSLSGGGYRAAAFHLGALEMLDELGLREDVRYLSTVSCS